MMHVDVETGRCSHVSLVPWLDMFIKRSATVLKNVNEHEEGDTLDQIILNISQ